jgi:hypothetical protein
MAWLDAVPMARVSKISGSMDWFVRHGGTDESRVELEQAMSNTTVPGANQGYSLVGQGLQPHHMLLMTSVPLWTSQ